MPTKALPTMMAMVMVMMTIGDGNDDIDAIVGGGVVMVVDDVWTPFFMLSQSAAVAAAAVYAITIAADIVANSCCVCLQFLLFCLGL